MAGCGSHPPPFWSKSMHCFFSDCSETRPSMGCRSKIPSGWAAFAAPFGVPAAAAQCAGGLAVQVRLASRRKNPQEAVHLRSTVGVSSAEYGDSTLLTTLLLLQLPLLLTLFVCYLDDHAPFLLLEGLLCAMHLSTSRERCKAGWVFSWSGDGLGFGSVDIRGTGSG